MERDIVRFFWISSLRLSLVSAFSPVPNLCRIPSVVLAARDPPLNPIPHRGGSCVWSDLFSVAQEKDSGVSGNAAGHRCNSVGWLERKS